MGKFQEVYEETKEVFNTHISNSGIPGFVNIKILSNESLKDCFGQVTKAQDIVKFMTESLLKASAFLFTFCPRISTGS